MIKPDELYEYMILLLDTKQIKDEKITLLLPVIVMGIIKAVFSLQIHFVHSVCYIRKSRHGVSPGYLNVIVA